MKVIISGCRYAEMKSSWKIIDDFLATLPQNAIIIHGDCKGVDLIADVLARKRDMTVHSKPADWKKYGKGAGPKRNQEMLEENPDLVVVFHPCLDESLGSKHMYNIATKRGVKTLYIKL